jgi:hypothetical protein
VEAQSEAWRTGINHLALNASIICSLLGVT